MASARLATTVVLPSLPFAEVTAMTDRLAVADAVERERRARRAEGLDERGGALEVADDVARAVDCSWKDGGGIAPIAGMP